MSCSQYCGSCQLEAATSSDVVQVFVAAMHPIGLDVSITAACLSQSLTSLQVLCSNPEKPRQHEQPRETVANCFMCQVSDPASVGATDVLRPDIIDLISDDEVSPKTCLKPVLSLQRVILPLYED